VGRTGVRRHLTGDGIDYELAAPPANGGAHLRTVPLSHPQVRALVSHRRVAGRANPSYNVAMANAESAQSNDPHPPVSFDEIVADFELLEDWEDRYRYVIELGRKLPPLPEEARTPANKVQGCVSQVWLDTTVDQGNRAPRLSFLGDSDAHIVRGLIAILFALYSGKTADAILATDANGVLTQLHLKEHLTPQRSNGLVAMVERIRRDARQALEQAPQVH
jgi:cysteine desulfuration protein SufE